MELHEKIKINGIEVDCEIDTGTLYTVLKKDVLEKEIKYTKSNSGKFPKC